MRETDQEKTFRYLKRISKEEMFIKTQELQIQLKKQYAIDHEKLLNNYGWTVDEWDEKRTLLSYSFHPIYAMITIGLIPVLYFAISYFIN